ncbi:MAG: NAD(P)/FAD-dependent oxidoreductase [Actinomycetota bacterium]
MSAAGAYDVIVVGGGIIGLSVARELKRAGVERVAVLEREGAVGQLSSSRANGGVRAQFTTPVNISFSLYSIGEFERLAAAHDDLLQFHQTGYLFATGTARGESLLRAAVKLQRSVGLDVEWLTPAEVVKLAPIMRSDGLRGGTWHARDGFLDPYGAVEVMRREARALGAELRLNSEVRALERVREGFKVSANRDELRAVYVVNAAGAHARLVGELMGVEVPVFPVRRNLAFVRASGHPTDLIPMCVDFDTGVLVRREVGGGYLIAYSNPTDEPGWETGLDPRFLDEVSKRIGNRFPRVAEVPIDPRHCWAGLYPETQDHHAIVGMSPEIEGFVQCAGFGGHGVMHAPAAGRAVSELVTQGSCSSFDLHVLRPSRFAEGDLTMESAVF